MHCTGDGGLTVKSVIRTRFETLVVGVGLADAGLDEVVDAGATVVVDAGTVMELVVVVVEGLLFFPLLQAPSVTSTMTDTTTETRTRAETAPGRPTNGGYVHRPPYPGQ